MQVKHAHGIGMAATVSGAALSALEMANASFHFAPQGCASLATLALCLAAAAIHWALAQQAKVSS